MLNHCQHCGAPLGEPVALTLEQLKQMDKPAPVYVVDLWGDMQPHWELVCWEMIWACPLMEKLHTISLDGHEDYIDLDNYGETWLAYTHKPETGRE